MPVQTPGHAFRVKYPDKKSYIVIARSVFDVASIHKDATTIYKMTADGIDILL